MRILFATDGSEYSAAAAHSVGSSVWPEGSELRIISVLEVPISVAPETWVLPEGYYDELERASRQRGQDAIDNALEIINEYANPAVTVTSEVIAGMPKNTIVEEAERWGADLLVLGSHGYGRLERFLLGSVSLYALHHAPCSVRIVRTPDLDDRS